MTRLCRCRVSDIIDPVTLAKSPPGALGEGSSASRPVSRGDKAIKTADPAPPSTAAEEQQAAATPVQPAAPTRKDSSRKLTPTLSKQLESDAKQAKEAGTLGASSSENAAAGRLVAKSPSRRTLETTPGYADWWEKVPMPVTGTIGMPPGKFNSIQMSSMTAAPLQYIALNALAPVAKDLGLDFRKLESFAEEVESSMPDTNAYHNAVHVADVVQLMYQQTLPGGPLEELCKDNYVRLAALLAAIVHDLKHPGRTNNFLTETKDPIIDKYGQAEMMHAELSVEMLERHGVLEPLPAEARERVYGLIRSTVLGTNMARHMDIIKAGIPDEPEARLKTMLCFAMKTADLSHCVRNFKIHVLFTDRLKEEFYNQGDVEKELNIKVSMGMDRSEEFVEVARSQVGFLSSFIAPLFDTWATASGGARLVTQLQELLWRNIDTWGMLGLKPNGPAYSDQLVAVRRKAAAERTSALSKALSMNDQEAMQMAVQQTMYGMLELRRGTNPIDISRAAIQVSMEAEGGAKMRRSATDLAYAS